MTKRISADEVFEAASALWLSENPDTYGPIPTWEWKSYERRARSALRSTNSTDPHTSHTNRSTP